MLGGNDNRRQIRLREVTIILAVLFIAHGVGFAKIIIPAQCLLDNLFTFFQQLCLPARLIRNGTGNRTEGIQVFHFAARTVFCASFFPQRQIYIAAHRAFLHFAIRYAKGNQQLSECLQKGADLGGGAKIRIGHDFNQRYGGTVVVRAAGGLLGQMYQFARILFHMNLGKANGKGRTVFID